MNEERPLRRAPRPLRVSLSILLACLMLLLVLGGTSSGRSVNLSAEVHYDQTIAAILSQVTTQTLAHELAGLTGERAVSVAGAPYTIATRHSYQTEAISMATRYAYEQLAQSGLDVAYHEYTYSGYPLRNVVAEKPGFESPDRIYLIAAHVDDLPSGPRAPGADDNGSGAVAVLMAARLLAPHRFGSTLRFVLFTGEEQGLQGSRRYAADCAARDEEIGGVINLDMIGYNTGAPVYDAYARSGSYKGAAESRAVGDMFSDVTALYDLDLIPRRIDSDSYPLVGGSDQWSFLSLGYPAILVIEDYAGGDFTPYYHQVSDTLSTLDLGYYADLTRAAIATLAHLGDLRPGGYLSGTIHGLGRPVSATVDLSTPAYAYTFTRSTDAGGIYSLSLPVGSYTATVWPARSGYYPARVAGIAIVTDAVTVRDIALSARWHFYLPWIIQDG